MLEKTIVTLVVTLCTLLVFSGCTQLDRIEDQIENKVDRIEDTLESNLDPIEDAIESKFDAVEDALEGNHAPVTNVVDSTTEVVTLAEESTLTQEPTSGSDSVPNTAEITSQSNLISEDDAKNIALQHAKIAAADAVFDRVERDFDRGIFHYEIEFRVGYIEYDYDIHAETGEILSFERD